MICEFFINKGKEIPSFPAGNGGVEAGQNRFETIHPCIGSFYFPSFPIHFLIEKPFLCLFPSVSRIRADIGYDSMIIKGSSEFLAIEAGIEIAEKTIHRNVGGLELPDYLIYSVLYIIEVGMIAGLRFGHLQRYSLIVGKEEGICRASLLPALILNLLTATICRSMGPVNMGKRQIKAYLPLVENPGIYSLPFILSTPFAVMMEYCVPARNFTAEEMAHWKKPPLATTFQLVEDGVDNLHKIEFGDKSLLCNRKMWHNFRFYCIFVEYSVFCHWYGILECGNYNIVRTLRNALYFNYFTESLTSQNKFKQLHLINVKSNHKIMFCQSNKTEAKTKVLPL